MLLGEDKQEITLNRKQYNNDTAYEYFFGGTIVKQASAVLLFRQTVQGIDLKDMEMNHFE